MIELTLEEFLLWVVGVAMLIIGFYTLGAAIKRRSTIRARRLQIIRCRACGHVYQNRSRDRSPECPECGRANDRGDSRRLG